jgi:hypothetical protein
MGSSVHIELRLFSDPLHSLLCRLVSSSQWCLCAAPSTITAPSTTAPFTTAPYVAMNGILGELTIPPFLFLLFLLRPLGDGL